MFYDRHKFVYNVQGLTISCSMSTLSSIFVNDCIIVFIVQDGQECFVKRTLMNACHHLV